MLLFSSLLRVTIKQALWKFSPAHSSVSTCLSTLQRPMRGCSPTAPKITGSLRGKDLTPPETLRPSPSLLSYTFYSVPKPINILTPHLSSSVSVQTSAGKLVKELFSLIWKSFQ
ncbi:hypothetical protein AMECASPLE_030114 [Ameca splendens]|uniref:Uncharacterized protein n=1 Tax=Ameca splendens TaxID=208324 RepID=A0ABV0Z5H1_9TELE